MKTQHNIFPGWSALSAALLISLTPLVPATLGSEIKGAGRLLELSRDHGTLPGRPLRTAADVQAVTPGSLAITSCPKCKNVTVTRITHTKPHKSQKHVVAVHECPACHTKIEVVGQGKAKQRRLTHICPMCGSKEAFCSVVTPSKRAGQKPTESGSAPPVVHQH